MQLPESEENCGNLLFVCCIFRIFGGGDAFCEDGRADEQKGQEDGACDGEMEQRSVERDAEEIDGPPNTKFPKVVRMSAELEQPSGSETSLILFTMPVIPLEEVVLGLLEGVLLLVGKRLDAETEEEEHDCEKAHWGERLWTTNRKQREWAGEGNEKELLVTCDEEQIEDDPTERISYPFVENAPAVILLAGVPASACKVVGKACSPKCDEQSSDKGTCMKGCSLSIYPGVRYGQRAPESVCPRVIVGNERKKEGEECCKGGDEAHLLQGREGSRRERDNTEDNEHDCQKEHEYG